MCPAEGCRKTWRLRAQQLRRVGCNSTSVVWVVSKTWYGLYLKRGIKSVECCRRCHSIHLADSASAASAACKTSLLTVVLLLPLPLPAHAAA
jgi:hypothetical protein